jgi:Leucine-rich repeat (LRR) protein
MFYSKFIHKIIALCLLIFLGTYFFQTFFNSAILNLNRNILEGLLDNEINFELIDLSYRKIYSIDSQTFAGLKDLKYLRLESNYLSSIDLGTFDDLNNLEILFLFNNKLKSIHPAIFSNLLKLKYLNLNGNQLYSIESTTFYGLTNLVDLNLGLNLIQSIDPNTLNGLVKLQTLYLYSNQLNVIYQVTKQLFNLLKCVLISLSFHFVIVIN